MKGRTCLTHFNLFHEVGVEHCTNWIDFLFQSFRNICWRLKYNNAHKIFIDGKRKLAIIHCLDLNNIYIYIYTVYIYIVLTTIYIYCTIYIYYYIYIYIYTHTHIHTYIQKHCCIPTLILQNYCQLLLRQKCQENERKY